MKISLRHSCISSAIINYIVVFKRVQSTIKTKMSSQRNGEIEVTTAGRANLLPQSSMMDTSDGPMPMQEEVRLDVAELTTQPIPYEGERRKDYLSLCVPLYEAAIKGDWKAAKDVIDKDHGVVRAGITRKRETALHIAAAAKRTAFVKELVEHMEEEDLALKNKDENTAICFAAASGIVEIAEVMVKKNKNLTLIRGNQGKTPLYMAALFGHRDMVSYLYDVTDFESLTPEERISLLLGTISADLYDLALKILDRDTSLALARDANNETALHVLARKPSKIANKSQLGIWKRYINSCFKGIYHEDLMRTFAHQLVKKLWERVLQQQDSDISKLIKKPSRLLFDAAELDLIAAYKDGENNNILHLAGNLPPPSRLQIVSGAALQMQRELLWFKAVEKIVPPSYIKMRNSDEQTPKDLFTERHKDLLKEGEKWMKSTATSCMLVATLIATVVFAAIFTLPGGNNNDNGAPPPSLEEGAPLFLEKKWFLIFVISDAVALFSSAASIIMFLSILTSRYAENDFLVSLPARLMFGLSALFVSIATMSHYSLGNIFTFGLIQSAQHIGQENNIFEEELRNTDRMWIIHFSNSINTPFPIRILLREANWSDHRPKFKATVNFNGKELLAASSLRAVDIYIRYKIVVEVL
ncbi:hypothetical protein CMV_020489 [Castanea mollissima]|uniref:PGG domain-containing protein n=1 Tax=Castanea mollissima TaxID=60419 RepID=A0A8J4QYE1_9ROSI|nr:hypothetical protein CMV_020489 [Castanea mollissima]